MWNKQRQDEEPTKPYQISVSVPATTTDMPVETRNETTTVSSIQPRSFNQDRSGGSVAGDGSAAAGGSASIGKAVKINGQIYSKEDLYVDGDVEGTLECPEHKLTIGPNGVVHAAVKAREVVALGTIQGNVDAADRIEIRKDARLVGDIRTARIVIEDGAYFKGSVDIVKPELAKVNMPRTKATAAHTPAVDDKR